MKIPSSTDIARNGQLDLLRATAILVVVFHHLIQMSPVPLPALNEAANYGQYGVDLFFVLSGWLIGGLYWRESAKFGDVHLVRFWLRRWLRTVPPYLAALALSWLAVWWQRGERFDWGYLLFLQNYYERIPFFLVSWSLCIEEHFYLFVPLLLALAARRRGAVTLVVLPLLVLAAPAFRWWQSLDGVAGGFGFEKTATHLRMEGLLLGFWLSYLPQCKPEQWQWVRRQAPRVMTAAALVFVAVQFMPPVWNYRLGLTALAAALAALLVVLVERAPGAVAGSRAIKGIALASYSIYLVHPLMIHLARMVSGKLSGQVGALAYFPVALGLVTVAGAGFYLGVERTSILLRDRWAPRRGTSGHA